MQTKQGGELGVPIAHHTDQEEVLPNRNSPYVHFVLYIKMKTLDKGKNLPFARSPHPPPGRTP
jgi:hypothetical protein